MKQKDVDAIVNELDARRQIRVAQEKRRRELLTKNSNIRILYLILLALGCLALVLGMQSFSAFEGMVWKYTQIYPEAVATVLLLATFIIAIFLFVLGAFIIAYGGTGFLKAVVREKQIEQGKVDPEWWKRNNQQ